MTTTNNQSTATVNKNEEILWVNNHKICNEQVTRSLLCEIGRWDSARFVRSYSNWVGTGYRSYIYRLTAGQRTFEALIKEDQGAFLQEVHEVDLAAEKAAKQAFYRKAKSLAEEAGVPYAIAAMLKNIDGEREKNLAALAEARLVHFARLDEESMHELHCGIDRRNAEIYNLLIRYADLFTICGQIRSWRLADYLANRR